MGRVIMQFFQETWDGILARYGTNPYIYRVIFVYIFSAILYFGYAGLFSIMDVTLSPKALRKYKTQVGANEPLDMAKCKRMIKVVLFTILWQFPLLLVIREFPFYYSHALLHHRLFYKRFHKMHHEWTAPIAMAGVYAHPVEHVVSNLFPVALGPMLLKCHVVTAWMWYAYAVAYTVTTHSGYHLPWMMSPEYHDYHHLKFNLNYGTQDMFLDWFHGTDAKFWAPTGNGKRHKYLLTTKSARELYPDESEKISTEVEVDGKAKVA